MKMPSNNSLYFRVNQYIIYIHYPVKKGKTYATYLCLWLVKVLQIVKIISFYWSTYLCSVLYIMSLRKLICSWSIDKCNTRKKRNLVIISTCISKCLQCRCVHRFIRKKNDDKDISNKCQSDGIFFSSELYFYHCISIFVVWKTYEKELMDKLSNSRSRVNDK
jgi:hypothetical protein